MDVDNETLTNACLERYKSLLKYYRGKYKRIKTQKIVLDLLIFAVSSGGITCRSLPVHHYSHWLRLVDCCLVDLPKH